MPRKQQVDTPFAGSWADEQQKQSVALHHAPMHPTHQEEQKLIDTTRRFPLLRVMGNTYAEHCTKKVRLTR